MCCCFWCMWLGSGRAGKQHVSLLHGRFLLLLLLLLLLVEGLICFECRVSLPFLLSNCCNRQTRHSIVHHRVTHDDNNNNNTATSYSSLDPFISLSLFSRFNRSTFDSFSHNERKLEGVEEGSGENGVIKAPTIEASRLRPPCASSVIFHVTQTLFFLFSFSYLVFRLFSELSTFCYE